MPLLRTEFKNPLAELNASRICFGSAIIDYSPILDSSSSIPHVCQKQLSFCLPEAKRAWSWRRASIRLRKHNLSADVIRVCPVIVAQRAAAVHTISYTACLSFLSQQSCLIQLPSTPASGAAMMVLLNQPVIFSRPRSQR